MKRLDLNCDLGEGAGQDAELMALISSANIACGGHAGTRESMRATLELALHHGVAIGAHPGYEDRDHFGRRPQALTRAELATLLQSQILALATLAEGLGARLHHVKLHGALYHQASGDASMAEVVIETLRGLDPALKLYVLAGSPLQQRAEQAGITVVAEGFADRRYRADGTLVPRGEPGAQIQTREACLRQLHEMVMDQQVQSIEGQRVPIRVGTLCLHGDGPQALPFARGIRDWMARHGVRLSAPGP